MHSFGSGSAKRCRHGDGGQFDAVPAGASGDAARFGAAGRLPFGQFGRGSENDDPVLQALDLVGVGNVHAVGIAGQGGTALQGILRVPLFFEISQGFAVGADIAVGFLFPQQGQHIVDILNIERAGLRKDLQIVKDLPEQGRGGHVVLAAEQLAQGDDIGRIIVRRFGMQAVEVRHHGKQLLIAVTETAGLEHLDKVALRIAVDNEGIDIQDTHQGRAFGELHVAFHPAGDAFSGQQVADR